MHICVVVSESQIKLFLRGYSPIKLTLMVKDEFSVIDNNISNYGWDWAGLYDAVVNTDKFFS